MTSVFKTTNGGRDKWCAQKYIGKVNGRNRYIRAYGDTQELALSALDRLTRHRLMNPSTQRKPSSPTLKKYLSVWLKHIESKGVTPSTLLKYQRDMDNHVIPVLGSKPINSITEADISNLLIDLSRSIPGAQEHIFSEMRNLFIYAEKSGAIQSNPMRLLSNKKRTPAIRDKQEKFINRYVSMARGLRRWLEQEDCPFHDDYPRLMVLLLGLRREEILGLTWDCITGLNKKNGAHITIKQVLKRHDKSIEGVSGWYIRHSTKNGKSRTFPLPEPWRKALLMQKSKGLNGAKGTEWENLVFVTNGHNYTYNAQWQWWRKLLTAYWQKGHPGEDLPDDYYWRPHDNRHVLASIMGELGVPLPTAQAILGHLDAAMTLYYTHAMEEGLKDAMTTVESKLL